VTAWDHDGRETVDIWTLHETSSSAGAGLDRPALAVGLDLSVEEGVPT
jgi:hypothetical protein